jgi:hypothetical protein
MVSGKSCCDKSGKKSVGCQDSAGKFILWSMKDPTSGSMALSTSSWCGKTIFAPYSKKDTKIQLNQRRIGIILTKT